MSNISYSNNSVHYKYGFFKTVLSETIQFSVSTVSMSKPVLFQTRYDSSYITPNNGLKNFVIFQEDIFGIE